MKIISYDKTSGTGLDQIHHVTHHILLFGKRVFTWKVDRPAKSEDWMYRNFFQSMYDDYSR